MTDELKEAKFLIKKFFKQEQKSPQSMDDVADYLKDELKTTLRIALKKLRKAINDDDDLKRVNPNLVSYKPLEE